jgi:hypothetical protein
MTVLVVHDIYGSKHDIYGCYGLIVLSNHDQNNNFTLYFMSVLYQKQQGKLV